MLKLKGYLCFALLMLCISYVFAESVAPLKESEITYDSKHRFSCGGYAMKGMVSELDVETEIYKADTDTLVCVFTLGVQKCADGSRCKCPPAGWDENQCWTTYSKLRRKYLENLSKSEEPQSLGTDTLSDEVIECTQDHYTTAKRRDVEK